MYINDVVVLLYYTVIIKSVARFQDVLKLLLETLASAINMAEAVFHVQSMEKELLIESSNSSNDGMI